MVKEFQMYSDLLYLLLDHVGRMVDKVGGQVDGKEGAA